MIWHPRSSLPSDGANGSSIGRKRLAGTGFTIIDANNCPLVAGSMPENFDDNLIAEATMLCKRLDWTQVHLKYVMIMIFWFLSL